MGIVLYPYMTLKIPSEPNDIKRQMLAQKNNFPNILNIEWDGFVVWAGTQNKLQSYLWTEWKSDLGPKGFTWQTFTKLLRYKTDRMVFWYRGMISWNVLSKEIVEFIEGKYGQGIVKS